MGRPAKSATAVQAAMVLGIFERAAKEGAPCPKGREIEEETGLTAGAVSYLTKRLVQAGRITLESRCRTIRRVGIPALQCSTGWTGHPVAEPMQEAPLSATVTIAEQVKAEAIDAGTRRASARRIGSVTAGVGLTVGQQMQMTALRDGPGAGVAVMREAWPSVMDLLARICARTAERPIPALVRLIKDEAARLQLRPIHERTDDDEA